MTVVNTSLRFANAGCLQSVEVRGESLFAELQKAYDDEYKLYKPSRISRYKGQTTVCISEKLLYRN